MLLLISWTTLYIANLPGIFGWSVKEVIHLDAKEVQANRKEVFVFSTTKDNYKLYDWSKITTLVECNYHDAELVAFAHSKNALVSRLANFPKSILTNNTQIDQWVADHVNRTVSLQVDGINVDFEEDIAATDFKSRVGLTSLFTKLASRLRAVLPAAQLTVDFAWSPNCIDDRCYDYKSIADVVDFAFIMAYDERSRIYDECIAWANSAINTTTAGVKQFLALGIPSDKLVLGVPWYGYDYPCVNYSEAEKKCTLKHVPFRVVNCSDAAGSQHGYSSVMQWLKTSLTGRLWDEVAKSPYFTYQPRNDKAIHQVWFDDAESLAIKYQLSTEFNLRGVGMWEADSLIYDDTPEMRKYLKDMWGGLPN